MPLPTGNIAWPPTSVAQVYPRLASWSAWYAGDPDGLAQVYGATVGNPYDSHEAKVVANHPSQYRGGVVGFFARWFWGEPVSVGERRSKLHVPVAGDIAATSADLLFSEPPTTAVDDERTQKRLDELVDDGMHAKLLEAAEIGAALGGVYLRVCWDTDNADRPWISAVHADAAVPDWQWWDEKLAAVTFWRVISQDGQKVVRWLERHEPGAILHGVYEGSPTTLGKPRNLADYEQTRDLQPEVQTGIDKLTAVYIPNMRPNRLWRNVPAAAYCGRSDLFGVEPLMDALDEVYSSWMRDLRLGKGRVIVPDVYLQSLGSGKGARWDPEREVYASLNMMVRPDSPPQITVQQFAIRVQEHRDSATEFATKIVEMAGYSAQTFGLAGDVAITATEVEARERKSLITRKKKINYWRPGLADILETLLLIDQAVFRTPLTPAKPDLEFADVAGEDPQALAQTAQLLRAAEAASTDTLVRMVHPDWDDTAIDEEIQKIKDEGAAKIAPPDQMNLGDPNHDPGAQPPGKPADQPPGK
jgi:A118 family predicted phage portal protein